MPTPFSKARKSLINNFLGKFGVYGCDGTIVLLIFRHAKMVSKCWKLWGFKAAMKK
jgi:hypothetical protein